jgi:hypothetical protein
LQPVQQRYGPLDEHTMGRDGHCGHGRKPRTRFLRNPAFGRILRHLTYFLLYRVIADCGFVVEAAEIRHARESVQRHYTFAQSPRTLSLLELGTLP